jgi:hypothetical protein
MSVAPSSSVFASYSSLDHLMHSLTSYTSSSVTDASNGYAYQLTAGTAITNFLLNQGDSGAYDVMVNAIDQWESNPSVAYHSLYGVTISDASADFLMSKTGCGVRVQIIQSNGVTAYDSNSTNNKYNNVNKPANGFDDSTSSNWGKWLINENQNSRPYNIGALLSNSGTFYYTGYSSSVSTEQMYYATRQGNSANYPLGNIVVSMNVQPVNQIGNF